MIFTKLDTWKYEQKLEGLLFFSQRLLELSYDKSDYTEKSMSIPIKDVIEECLEYIDLEDKGLYSVSKTEMDMLFEEIKDYIRCDSVAKELLGIKIDYYFAKLNVDNDNNTIRNILEIIDMKINPDEYYSELKRVLKEAIVDYNKKDNLITLTTQLFKFLISYGYQKGTIYFLINKCFFDKEKRNKIDSIDDVDKFFDYFDLEFKLFEVVFVASNIYKEIDDSCSQLGLEVIEERKPLYNKSLEGKFYRNGEKKKVYIKVSDVKAVDYQHAMRKASERIGLLSDLFVVFSHRSKPWFSDYCLVYKHDKENVVKITKQNNTMSSLSENEFSYTKKLFPIFISRFGLKSDSFQRFNRGVELHAHALETDELASQILNLWICLEALLITSKTKSHIAKVMDSVGLINKCYTIRTRISNLRQLLLQWNKEEFLLIKNKLDLSSNDDIVVAALVGLYEYKDIAGELLSKMQDQPLLRYKFMKLVREI
ncbi:hypothetical protein [Aliivibrio fischeri]|uniref:hypothetical protein n=1 Tax=Aliivibrio fischeri TaxID=668 RepID=UPI0007C4BE59|nr:hypothetical protein [Aliivibrio fischeri]